MSFSSVENGDVKTFRCRTQAIQESQHNSDSDAAWERVASELAEGDAVTGTVLHVAPYGAFLDIGFGVYVKAILNVPEFANTSSPILPEDYPEVGDTMTATVRHISWDQRKIALTQVQIRNPETGGWTRL